MAAEYRLYGPMATVLAILHGSLWVTLFWFLITMPASAETVSGRAHAEDGDSLTLRGKRVRLHGIDAFEYRQSCGKIACGKIAADGLRRLVQGQTVSCTRQDTDQYGRMVATCRLPDGRDLGREMVRRGYAIAYRRYTNRYVADEQAARRAKAGAWAYGFKTPMTYRKTNKR